MPDYYVDLNAPASNDAVGRLIHKIAGSVNKSATEGPTLTEQQIQTSLLLDAVTALGAGTDARIKKIDEVSTALLYYGEASPGTADGTAAWRIKKIDFNNPITILFAGTGDFNQIWTNRAGLTYS